MKERNYCVNLQDIQEINQKKRKTWPKVPEQQLSDDDMSLRELSKHPSMHSLITWNISKALEKDPRMDLKAALRRTQKSMESRPGAEITTMSSQTAVERHLLCALLAWQQLGHHGAESLTDFAEAQRLETPDRYDEANDKENISSKGSEISSSPDQEYLSMEPLTALPHAVSKVVMHAYTRPASNRDNINPGSSQKARTSDEKSTVDLRRRAAMLASREARRAELLERAEMTWRDLELGYERRLRFAEGKEDTLTKQIPLLIKERDSYKSGCNTLCEKLKEVSVLVCDDRADLKVWETKVFDLACARHRLGGEAAREDGKLHEQQCKAAQMDRDFQLRESQVKRKLSAVKSDMEAARLLRIDTETGFRAELEQLKAHVQEVSRQLLREDADNTDMKAKLAEIQKQKKTLDENMHILMKNCDGGVKRRLTQLQQKRRQLVEEQAKVVDCSCKLPVDAAVMVKRTPSLAATCHCKVFEGMFSESCSCTSLRSKLLSDLFSDLFSGLQNEMGGAESFMPCQMLNCLHDDHNWDRATVVKTNLNKFFSKLLLGELDIAIATSIEKYRAKWVGTTCEDVVKQSSNTCNTYNESWQKQEVERRAMEIAEQFAEKIMQKQADILKEKFFESKTIPEPEHSKTHDVLTCQVKPTKSQTMPLNGTNYSLPQPWSGQLNHVTQLRIQTDSFKKVIPKKIENNKRTSQAPRTVDPDSRKIVSNKEIESREVKNVKVVLNRIPDADQVAKFVDLNPIHNLSDHKSNSNNLKNQNKCLKKNLRKKCDRAGQTYAVNICICNEDHNLNDNIQEFRNKSKSPLNKNQEQNKHHVPVTKQSKPITGYDVPKKISKSKKKPCNCFNNTPSNSSIDKLLETLVKWKYEGFPPLKIKNSSSKIYCNNCIINKSEINDVRQEGSSDINNREQQKVSKSIIKENNKAKHQNSCKEKYSTSLINSIIKDFDICLKDTNSNICNKTGSKINVVSIENYSDYQVTDNSLQIVPISGSIYMGEVSLDKSECKCVSQEETNSNQNTNCGSQYGFKCINDHNCNCKYVNNQEINIDNVQNSSLQTTTLFNTQKTEEEDIAPQKSLQEHLSNSLHQNNKREENCLDNTKQLSSCDFNVKFFGATSTKCTEDTPLRNENIGGLDSNKNTNIGDSQNINLIKNKHKNHKRKGYSLNQKNMPHRPTCKCCNDFEEFKIYFNNLFAKYCTTSAKIEDKALDAQSFNKDFRKSKEPCILCRPKNFDETKNLEIDTFTLLKEHLKEKLKQMKISTNKLNNTESKEDEQFSLILVKVRAVLSEYIKSKTCRCKNTMEIKGSWDKAYCLLEEYLKTKLKRVQCVCASSSTDPKNKDLLDILNKVCSLIENDFERLKNKSNKKEDIEEYKNEMPEKDVNSSKANYKVKYDRGYAEEGKKSICKLNINPNCETKHVSIKCQNTYSQNATSQVSNNYFTESKPTEPMIMCLQKPEKGFSEKREAFIQDQNPKSIVNIIHQECQYSPALKNTSDLNQKQGNNKVISPECLELLKDDRALSIPKTPYVGCTVTCSCDLSLGACFCSKSAINDEKIRSMWNDFVAINKNFHNQYIMTKASNKENTLIQPINYSNLSLFNNPENLKKSTNSTLVKFEDESSLLKHSQTCKADTNFATAVEIPNQESPSKLNKNDTLVEVNSIMEPSDVLSESVSHACDCKAVPICHVKMLLENIENNLAQSKCVCDSMDFKVCPVHSKIAKET